MQKIIHIITFLLISLGISAQNSDKYWDKDRATKSDAILEDFSKLIFLEGLEIDSKELINERNLSKIWQLFRKEINTVAIE